MKLEELENSHHEWLIEDFVEVANQLLPHYLPEIKGNTKVKEEINPRLVRHYTSQRLMDEAIRKNRYAFYCYRHLLQLLLVRRLLSDGIGAAAINDLLTSKTNEELKSLLTGGIQIRLTTAHPNLTENSNSHNSALEYLANLKKGKQKNLSINEQKNFNINDSKKSQNAIDLNTNLEGINNQPQFSQLQSSSSKVNQWNHLQVLDGLEIHIRDDFIYPNSIKEQESLNQYLIETLIQFLARKKS
ncbi:hypothetical protein GM3708_3392 [Geminocystis sp. NIES-3708]|uniref:MerR family transcriptional regulator n=1 Tax=Geminocystis sp. NIES-3708 TaxID=1615909 RepID=UPI0005FC9D8B|nr:MerR family transcriptional regulator [Geminocystis sp. NIES-3708]BAQ62986.1 hypothetical protein GM3708_3392 [Geminocystis sp. NIES-3708]